MGCFWTEVAVRGLDFNNENLLSMAQQQLQVINVYN